LYVLKILKSLLDIAQLVEKDYNVLFEKKTNSTR